MQLLMPATGSDLICAGRPIVERAFSRDLEPDVAEPRMVGAMQAQRMMTGAAAEIGFTIAGVVHDRQPQHVLVVMLHLALLDGVEGKKAEAHDFDWHDCAVSPARMRPDDPTAPCRNDDEPRPCRVGQQGGSSSGKMGGES